MVLAQSEVIVASNENKSMGLQIEAMPMVTADSDSEEEFSKSVIVSTPK